jgi:RNA polymerase sigma-70 factor (ECF subfamily)
MGLRETFARKLPAPVPELEATESTTMSFAMREAPLRSETRSPVSTPDDGAEPTDEQLISAFAAGSGEAFHQLFHRYKQPLYGFFRRRLAESGQAHAEELTQETFLAVVRASSSYQPTALFRTWLYSIGFRLLHAHRRKSAFRATFLGSADVEREAARVISIDVDLQVRQALARLDRVDRELLMLREFEQLSYAEIAELLEIPIHTVRSRLFRARAALRAMLTAPKPSTANIAAKKDRA